MLYLNAKRTPKASGKKKKALLQDDILEEDVVEDNVDEGVDEDKGPARSQANPYAKKDNRSRKNVPEFIDTFSSSNIDAVAYDPAKKQLWVRFMGNDVYTYYDVPLNVYRGFWSAPSKGHYFWEKIRKNKHIKYQKLTASLHWIPYRQFGLNANKQANVAAIAKSFKNVCKQKYPDWGVEPVLQDVFNGKRVILEDVVVEIVGYGNKVRVNIINPVTHVAEFGTTEKTDTTAVVDYIVKRVNHYLANRALSALNSAINPTLWEDNVKTLYRYLRSSMRNEHWELPTVLEDEQAMLESDHYSIELVNGDSVILTVNDMWTDETHTFELDPSNWVNSAISYVYAIAFQGVLS